jgi:hypothetical protein
MTIALGNVGDQVTRGRPVVVSGEAVSLASVDWTPQVTGAVYTTRVHLTAGDLKVDFADGTLGVVCKALATGNHDMAVTKIYKTGTTATNITAYY